MNERGGVREAEEYQLTEIVVQVDDESTPEDAAALIRSTIKPFHPKDLVGVTVGRIDRERAPVERKTPQAKP